MAGFVDFTHPGYLALLAILPLMVVLAIRSMAGLGRVRRWLAIALRCAVLAALILALAGAHRVRTTDALTVFMVIDRSGSIPRESRERAFEFVTSTAPEMRKLKDRLGIIAVDGEAAVEQLPTSGLGIDQLSEPIQPEMTDLASGLRLAMALFTHETARRVVLITDGNENVRQVADEIDQYRAAGIPVDVLPIRYEHENEVIFDRLSAPAKAGTNETVNLQMILRSQAATSGAVRIYRNDQLIRERRVDLRPGPNRIEEQVSVGGQGAYRYRAEFVPDDPAVDTVVQNNVGETFTVVRKGGAVLILTAGDDKARKSADILRQALIEQARQRSGGEGEALVVDVRVAGQFPVDQVNLMPYALVILENTPAAAFSAAERDALALWVRELGGGLVMVGGDHSLGAGGWIDSPVEEVMPVTFDIKSKRIIPKGALCLLMHACEIPQANYWGERIAIAAVKTLSSRDLIGVLSYDWQGGDQGYWAVPLQTVGDKAPIIQKIRKFAQGDMPDMEPHMRAAAQALATREDAAVRHIIAISDFDPSPPSEATLRMLEDNNITVSTVAIGWGGHPINTNLAQRIAERTGGRFYVVKKLQELPRIFIKESQVVRRSLIQENPFVPRQANSLSPLVGGFRDGDYPPLGGYVLTTAKPLAQIPLVKAVEDGQDPVLAHWQVGLGKTVVFTSGMWDRWGAEWQAWGEFGRLWGQITRWAARQDEAANFDVHTSIQGGKGTVQINALDPTGRGRGDIALDGVVLGPGGEPAALNIVQTGPGNFEAEFDAEESGSYILNLQYSDAEGSGRFQSGVSVSFSPEYEDLRANEALLEEIVQKTGGRMLSTREAAEVFQMRDLEEARKRTAIWQDLVRLMLLLFLLDVAVRRIAINPVAAARRARQFLAEMAGHRRTADASAATLGSLKGAREQMRDAMRRPSEAGTPPKKGARYDAPVTDKKVDEQLSDAVGGASESDRPVVASPKKKPRAETSEGDYTSRLLQAKRKARGQQADEDSQDKS